MDTQGSSSRSACCSTPRGWRVRVAILTVAVMTAVGLAGCAGGQEPGAAPEVVVPARIDIHAHYTYGRSYLIPLLDAWNMQAMVVEVVRAGADPGRARWGAMRRHQQAHPRHLMLCASFDASRIEEPDFAEQVIAQLERDIADGARMVKVWKEVGMVIQDAGGHYIQIDDPRFKPIWDFLADAGIPVLAHIGEPRAAWLPLDEASPHYSYYRDNPQYHAYRHPEVPAWEAIMAARDRWLAENPRLTVVGAHLGSMAYDVDEVARRLDAYPNLFVETAARFGDLALQPSGKVRGFFVAYQDRLLYGTDLGIGSPADTLARADSLRQRARMDRRFQLHWDYLTTSDSLEFSDYGMWYRAHTRGLGLPAPVVEKFYYTNAARLLGL